MSASPQVIPLNAGDKLFLIPETEDLNGTHFPMSIIVSVRLRTTVTREQVADAVIAVNRRFPQFRLAYRIDPTRDRLVRVPESDLQAYLSSLVQTCTFDDPLDEVLSKLIAVNNTPISQPLMIMLQGPHLIMRMHHSFGDGKFIVQLMGYVLNALLTPETFQHLPELAPNYNLPLWRIVYKSPRQAVSLLGKWLKTLRGSVQEYQRDMSGTAQTTLEPIQAGSAMRVRIKTLSPDVLARLNTLRTSLSDQEKISLNTLLQVLVARRVCELGFSKPPVIYSMPVDLHRYLDHADNFYAGNLISQLRITGHVPFDLRNEAVYLQQQVRSQLDDMTALTTLPSEWLLMAAGKKTYKRINRGWLNASINTDPRFYIFSNLGAIDSQFQGLTDSLDLSGGVATLIPLMGGPHLVIGFNTLQGQASLGFTYDPRVLSDSDIDAIFEGFAHELAD